MLKFFTFPPNENSAEPTDIELPLITNSRLTITAEEALEKLKISVSTLVNDYRAKIQGELDLQNYPRHLENFIQNNLTSDEINLMDHFGFTEWLLNYAHYQFIENYLFHFKNNELEGYLAILCKHQSVMSVIFDKENSNAQLPPELIQQAQNLAKQKKQSESQHHQFFSKADQEFIKSLHQKKRELDEWLRLHQPQINTHVEHDFF